VRAVLQRVKSASVTVASELAGNIGPGLLVLVGIAQDDGPEDVAFMAQKIANLRVFEGDGRLMQRSVLEIGGAVLVVSQFTLLGDCRKGRRPSFDHAASPQLAEELYEALVAALSAQGLPVATGRFREMMEVSLVNDGPVTLLLDSKKRF